MVHQLVETAVVKITRYTPASNLDVRSLISFHLSHNGFSIEDMKQLSTRELIEIAREVSGFAFSFMDDERWGSLFDDEGELIETGTKHPPVALDFTKKQHYEIVTALRSDMEGRFSNLKLYSQPGNILFHVNKVGLIFAWSGLKVVDNEIVGTITFPESSLFAHTGDSEIDKKRFRMMRKALDVKYTSVGNHKDTGYVIDKIEDLEFILNEMIGLI